MEALQEFEEGYFYLAIVDPPYGIGETAYRANNRGKAGKTKKYNNGFLDKEIPPQEYFNELFRVSQHQIIWGINYFLPQRWVPKWPGRIVWNKVKSGNFSDCEIAYCSFHKSTRMFTFMWNGMLQGKSILEGHIQQGNKKLNEKRYHQNQKPVALYRWLLKEYAKPGFKILDTHLGSGSSRIAADMDGFDFWGYEIDEKCFEDQEERFFDYKRQLKLF